MLKKLFVSLAPVLFFSTVGTSQVTFSDYFENHTLRIDFELGGNDTLTMVFLKQMRQEPFWGGPVKNLTDPLGYGNFRYRVFDEASGRLIFEKGFGSLYEEWKATPEAKQVSRTFYQAAVMPFPKHKIRFEIDERQWADGSFRNIFKLSVDPSSYFILKEEVPRVRHDKVYGQGTSSESLDVAVIAEGYTQDQMEKFRADVVRVMGYILEKPPFNRFRDKVNIYAVESPSQQSGPDVPGEGIYNSTVAGSSYYTFDVDRYLTTFDYKTLCDYAATVPYDQIYVLINSPRYGGGGFYNLYTACTSDNYLTPKVSMHEFGHGFGGLADEYYNTEVAGDEFYNLKVEPWEPNITTRVAFDRKWGTMIDPSIPIPTPRVAEWKEKVGLFEGGGYVSKGIYSPAMDCNMKSNTPDTYCPVCQKAVEQRLLYITDHALPDGGPSR